MSRRRSRSDRPSSRIEGAPPSSLGAPAAITLPLVLTAAAVVLGALGGGMINDRWETRPGSTPVLEWISFPIARLAIMDIVGTPFAAIVGTLAFALLAWKGSARRIEMVPAFFTLFAIWTGLCAWLSPHHASVWPTAAVAVGAIATGGAVRNLARNRDAAVGIAIAIGGSATWIGLLGVCEYLVRWKQGNSLWRVFGGFVNPDFLAGYLLVALPITAALLLLAARPGTRVLAGLGLLLQTACLVLTGSRLGFAALALEIAVFTLVLWRSGHSGRIGRRMAISLALVVAATVVVAGRPVLRRLLGSGAESHSAKFRVLTWKGTLRMAVANPILGTGPGSFETAYPPYQVVGYTQHAHNGWLQVAAETGVPGFLLLILGLAGTVGYGMAILWRPSDPALPDPALRNIPESGPPDLLLAGCVVGIVGSAAHNFFDSDFYIPAVAFTLASATGIAAARITNAVPGKSAARSAVRLSRSGLRLLGPAALALWMLWNQGLTAAARVAANNAADAYEDIGRVGADGTAAQADLMALFDTAINGYRSARDLKPSEPEFALRLAGLFESSGQAAEAETVFRDTALGTRLGKAYYRYGRFLTRQNRNDEAFEMMRQSREREPNNLQTLLAYADIAKTIGKPGEAEAVYRRMIRLYRSDFGEVRPMPELVDWEFGMAFVQLGEMQLARNERDEAVLSLTDGARILGDFWRTRHLEIAVIRVRPDVRKETSSRYEWALDQLERLYDGMGKSSDAEGTRERLAEFRRERDEDKTRVPPS